ncbi:MAG: molybdenum cofactor biosynthesis protein MoaE [Planctomycetota bacterium]|jgi:molybdopterin synthase catalytic subunit
MKVTVIMLGPAQDLAAVESQAFTLEQGARLEDLVEILRERFPRMAAGLGGGAGAGLGAIRLAVNQEFCAADRELADGDEVAVIPPVSGGGGDEESSEHVALVREAIDPAAVRETVEGDQAVGGIVVFEGTTRAQTDPQHGVLTRLCYEAYAGMALKQMRGLVAEARRRWPIERVALVHRVGEVELTEASVVIVVACAHRSEAFAACRWLIDTLKQDVPIWKKEVWADGHETWVDPTRK